ncbi:RNA polymerase factor sigma-54 [Terriglobus sp.]|uniref:RNA polymerase factor sigma-54 n=1 Tax=Terriglobus sp. TaxID=1889013 RepID=UPI003B00D62A
MLTPGLVQMVSVLALNKLELKDMINAEVVENPLLEEIEDTSVSFDELAGREGDRELSAEQKTAEQERTEKDPFDEIDFGSYFQDYLDPGYRTGGGVSSEDLDAPSFEHFLSKPSTLTDHLLWQLSSMALRRELRAAAEWIVGNLETSGYLSASLEDLVAAANDPAVTPALAQEALTTVQALDPLGVGARSLTECLELQLTAQQREVQAFLQRTLNTRGEDQASPHTERELLLSLALRIVQQYLPLLQKRDIRELSRLLAATPEHTNAAIAIIRTLDPRPGQRFEHHETRLIEPDVAFARRGDDWCVVMNEEDMPALRLNAGYRRMLRRGTADREVQDYVKERYRSAVQLLRNIEQRKNTIVRTCEAIVRRQGEFLERGVDALRPMMIKEVAEEIGVHPSTISRAVSNKYVHTPQGVYELRFFFTEGVNGPEGGDLPLMLLKKKVRKLIEDENPAKPLTDDALVAELAKQGIQVTRRSVAKYREDMQIPSTHQRRQRS